jgi:hypothetical protein
MKDKEKHDHFGDVKINIELHDGEGTSFYEGKPKDLSFAIYKTMKEDHQFFHLVEVAVDILKLENPCESQEKDHLKN